MGAFRRTLTDEKLLARAKWLRGSGLTAPKVDGYAGDLQDPKGDLDCGEILTVQQTTDCARGDSKGPTQGQLREVAALDVPTEPDGTLGGCGVSLHPVVLRDGNSCQLGPVDESYTGLPSARDPWQAGCVSTFGERLRNARASRHMDQKELARRVGRTGGCLSRWEKQADAPRFSDVERLAEVLGVDPAWLGEGTGSSERGVSTKSALATVLETWEWPDGERVDIAAADRADAIAKAEESSVPHRSVATWRARLAQLYQEGKGGLSLPPKGKSNPPVSGFVQRPDGAYVRAVPKKPAK